MANENVNAAPQNAANEKELSEILQVRRDKLSALQEAGADPFQITKYDVTHHGQDIKDNYEELEGKEVAIAGRMMSKRIMGKASFCHVQDLSGTMQVYVARDSLAQTRKFRRAEMSYLPEIKTQSRSAVSPTPRRLVFSFNLRR